MRTRPYLFAVNMSNKKFPAPFHITLKQTVFVIKIYVQLVAPRSAAMFTVVTVNSININSWRMGKYQLLKAYAHIRESSSTLKKTTKTLMI